jgi:hypothetical protein
MYIMKSHDFRSERTLEIFLVLITAGMAAVLHHTDTLKIVVLNMFFLPVVLAGFFLGRYRAGVLALLCVVTSTIVVAQDLESFSASASPLVIGLAVVLWGAVLGLTSILVGTLSDDRAAKALEAHEAHVGVVEVLARYLQAANPNLESRAKRLASLCEEVGRRMRLSEKELDDIRVAALLMDIENIEITARVIKKAVGELEDQENVEQCTFHGSELVQSLGPVLSGAFPLLLNQTRGAAESLQAEIPFGARIIRTVRAYQELADDPWETGESDLRALVDQLRHDDEAGHHPAVLHALEDAVACCDAPQEPEETLAAPPAT